MSTEFKPGDRIKFSGEDEVVDHEGRYDRSTLLFLKHGGRIWTENPHVTVERVEPTETHTVFEHLPWVESDDGVKRSLCGKVWRPQKSTVSEGRCPVCADIVQEMWTK